MSEEWKPPLLLLFWRDAAGGNDGWIKVEEMVLPDLNCVSVGWLVSEDEHQITLTALKGEHASSGDINGTHTVPKPWIGRRITLDPGH